MKDWVAIDVETTGLDPLRHGLCEVGIVSASGAAQVTFFLPIDNVEIDPLAMEINKYQERAAANPEQVYNPGFATNIMDSWLSNVMIVCSPSFFDMGFLSAWYSRVEREHPWQHRAVIDLKSYAAGKWGTVAPLKNETIGKVLGIDDTSDHTALADARWTAAMFRALIA